MATPSAEEDPRHSGFLDLCLLYGDFDRPVFLQAILRWFVESAGRDELDSLRRAIRDRTKFLRRGGRKGRPRAENDWHWIRGSAQLVWQREVLRWSWPKMAAAAGMKPTKPNIRTLQNRRDRYAMLLWRATPSRRDDPQKLARILEAKSIQRLYRSRAALPFDTHPEECKKIVLKLAPRGPRVVANVLKRLVNRRTEVNE